MNFIPTDDDLRSAGKPLFESPQWPRSLGMDWGIQSDKMLVTYLATLELAGVFHFVAVIDPEHCRDLPPEAVFAGSVAHFQTCFDESDLAHEFIGMLYLMARNFPLSEEQAKWYVYSMLATRQQCEYVAQHIAMRMNRETPEERLARDPFANINRILGETGRFDPKTGKPVEKNDLSKGVKVADIDHFELERKKLLDYLAKPENKELFARAVDRLTRHYHYEEVPKGTHGRYGPEEHNKKHYVRIDKLARDFELNPNFKLCPPFVIRPENKKQWEEWSRPLLKEHIKNYRGLLLPALKRNPETELLRKAWEAERVSLRRAKKNETAASLGYSDTEINRRGEQYDDEFRQMTFDGKKPNCPKLGDIAREHYHALGDLAWMYSTESPGHKLSAAEVAEYARYYPRLIPDPEAVLLGRERARSQERLLNRALEIAQRLDFGHVNPKFEKSLRARIECGTISGAAQKLNLDRDTVSACLSRIGKILKKTEDYSAWREEHSGLNWKVWPPYFNYTIPSSFDGVACPWCYADGRIYSERIFYRRRVTPRGTILPGGTYHRCNRCQLHYPPWSRRKDMSWLKLGGTALSWRQAELYFASEPKK